MKSKHIILVSFAFLIVFLQQAEAADAPVKFYGQVLYKDVPFENLEVTAHWIDSAGKFHTTTAYTITKQQARSRRNEHLAGHYFFDDGSVTAKEGSNIVLKFQGFPYNLIFPANPKLLNFRVTTVSFNYKGSGGGGEQAVNSSFGYQDEEDITEEEIQELVSSEIGTTSLALDEESSLDFQDDVSSGELIDAGNNLTVFAESIPVKQERNEGSVFANDVFFIFLFILLAAGIIIIAYLGVKFGPTYVAMAITEITAGPVETMSRKILRKKLRPLAKEMAVVTPDATCMEVISSFIASDSEMIFVIKMGECIGYIRDDFFLNEIKDLNAKVSDVPGMIVQEKPVIESEDTVMAAYDVMRSLSLSKFLVTEGGNLIGEISLAGLQALTPGFTKYFSQGEKSGLPLVRDMIEKDYIVMAKEESAEKARKAMLSKRKDLVIVTENNDPIGIYTVWDHIAGLSKYGEHLSKHPIGGLMTTPIAKADPELNFFEANEMMMKNGYSRMPVIIHGEILGILTQEKVCEEVFTYMENAESRR